MEINEGAVEAPPAGQRTGIGIEIESDPTLGYASIQNSVPVIRSLRITNHGEDPLQDLQVLITCNPRFAQGANIRFDRLVPGESRRITPIDLQPDHAYLSDLQESVNATIKVTILAGIVEIANAAQPIEVLAYDQWAGTRALPELLAAFCMPNNPAVDLLIGKASKLLRSQHSELAMNGYQSKSRDIVWKQVSALYSTVGAENLQYSEPPASFGADGQKIRTPDRVLEGRVATCLDLAMIFASCLEQAGLRPVVLFSEGHAWVGVWLHEACFPDPLTDDVQAVRKRVNSGEFLVFETTGIAQHHSHRFSLRIAMEHGQDHLTKEEGFRYAVDIHRARELQIKPLPSRAPTVRRSEVDLTEVPTGIEPTPYLPPLDPAYLTPLDLTHDETPAGRLAKWKSRLLDLTLRNRLLNFKPTKSTLQFVAPDLEQLENALADGTEFRIRPLPAIMDGKDPRVAQVHSDRSGSNAVDDMALEALGNRELLARVPAIDLDAVLLAIYTAARTGLEEGGANTLYLAIGMLQWTEAERADTAHRAPILLIPVTLQRQSVRGGFRLTRHDDDAIINPTLLQLLRTSFEMQVTGLDVVPVADKGIDVERLLQLFRLRVAEYKKWEVLDQAHLGIFSFTKFLMWKDLQDRTEQLRANRVVRHLIDHPGTAFARTFEGDVFDRLDDTHPPQDILAPLLADSSQLKAICAVDAGHDLVLQGPPGTGKSQTIANLIAHSLAKGKTVLFVSEKMAALEVVYRRLDGIGLGPFCLELHSSKARKAAVVQQLGRALNLTRQRTSADWANEAERLAQLRQELNALVATLHRAHPNGLTVHAAIGTCIAHEGEEPSSMPWSDPLIHGRADLDRLRATTRQISALASALGTPHQHPLSQIGKSGWTPTWQDELLAAGQSLELSIHSLREKSLLMGKQLQLPAAGLSLAAYGAWDLLADILLAAPKVPAGLARQAHDAGARARVHALSTHGLARNGHWERVGAGWKSKLAKLNGTELQVEWSQASSTWWPRSFFGKRKVQARLAGFREDAKRPSESAVQSMLDPLACVNDEDQILRSMHADAEVLLQGAYAGLNTDWTSLAQHEQWAKKFADVVTLVAGVEGDRASELRLVLQPLVAENRAALAVDREVGKALLEYRDAWREFKRKLETLDGLAKPTEPIPGPARADGALERALGVLADWRSAKRLLQPWCLFRSARDHAIVQGLQGVVASVESGTVSLARIEEHFEFSYRNWWVKRTIDDDAVLRSFSSADHERKISEFRQADARFQKLTEAYIVATLCGRVPTAAGVAVGADSERGRLQRELQKVRGHTPIRKLVQDLPTMLPRLKPCLLMSPLSVAQYLDAGFAQFDLVVFDEASQIPVWDAVGAIARGKQLIVVGDAKQLPPTSFFAKSTDSAEDSLDDGQVEELESILDECIGAGMDKLSLLWHYRSRHESLITFSNINYYESSLITFPSPVTDDVAVRFERVHGVYDRGGTRTNRAEADAIIAGIEAHYLSPDKTELTLGVVTFNQTQQSLIDTLLDARRRANPALDRAIAERAHEPLFIKNLENVQGDERDVILFSITYGPDAGGRITMNFGPLNSEGGHRRLNVAISRAREAVVIYSTLMPEQIDLARVRAVGVRDLKHYLEFAIRGPRALVEQAVPTGLEPESPFEAAVIKALRDRGWVVHPQIGCSGYRIDLGVVDPRAAGRYLVGIECDGRSYHSGATARDRDRLRQHVLSGLGWQIYRIWSTDWWLNPEDEIKKVLTLLETLIESDSKVADQAPESATTSVDLPRCDNVKASTGSTNGADPADVQGMLVPVVDDVGASGLLVYTCATLSKGDPVRFYEPSANQDLTDHLRLVIETEGPIPEPELFRRVARAWGLERTGSRIVDRLRRLLPSSAGRTHDREATFYWPAAIDPTTWRQFRVAGPDENSRRNVADVCLEELGSIVLHILRQGGGTPRQDIARSASRLLGVGRTTGDAEARVNEAIDRLIAANVVAEVSGFVREVQ